MSEKEEKFSAARPLVMMGCGNMGGALLRGGLAMGVSREALWIVDPRGREAAPEAVPESQIVDDSAALPEDVVPRILLLAVKPQVMPALLPGLARWGGGGTLFVSIAAGFRQAAIVEALGPGTPVIRAMPNTPAATGRGITAGVRGEGVSKAHHDMVEGLFLHTGEFAWLAREEDLDTITAVSGSGPAYVFHLVEALQAAAVDAGLEAGLAAKFARWTVIGAGQLLLESKEDAATLRQRVTSPKGTTEAALKVLMDAEGGLTDLITRAVHAAAARSRELGS